MDDERKFYSVVASIWRLPLPDHLECGYETEQDFRLAVRRLVERWGGRVGECVCERNGHMRLRFHDTPGGVPDEAWIPPYVLKPADAPAPDDDGSTKDEELDDAFDFR